MFQSTFSSYASNSTSGTIPTGLFSSLSTANGTDFSSMFQSTFYYYASNSTSATIPAGLFSSLNTANGTDFSSMFQSTFYCYASNSISGTIPSGLFSSLNTANGTDFSSMFDGTFFFYAYNSTSGTIPAGLFSSLNTANGTDFSSMFQSTFYYYAQYSTSATIPAGLFSSLNTANGTDFRSMFNITFYYYAYNSTSATIPAGLFSNLDTSNGINFSHMFHRAFDNYAYNSFCALIPDGLFDSINISNAKNTTSMYEYTFSGYPNKCYVYFTVTFDIQDSTDIAQVAVKEGDSISRPEDPTRAGYKFVGWYTAKTGGTKFDFNTPITSDITLYAHWDGDEPTPTVVQYTVTFDTQGGTSISSKKVSSGATVTQPADTPTKFGYTFAGWYTAKTGGTKFNFNTKITKNITLYAHWTAIAMQTNTTAKDGILVGVFFSNSCDTSTNIYTSTDGINFKYISSTNSMSPPSGCNPTEGAYSGTPYRDPSIMYYNGYYYIISGNTIAGGSSATFNITASKDLKTWTNSKGTASISVPSSLKLPRGNDGRLDYVAPEWFLDSNGSAYILFSAGNYYEYSTQVGDTRPVIAKITNLSVTESSGKPSSVNFSANSAVREKSTDGRLQNMANRDVQVIKEGSMYYMFAKFQKLTVSNPVDEKSIEIYASSSINGPWKRFNDDIYNNLPDTTASRAFEGPSVVNFRGKKFIYADNYWSDNKHVTDGGKIYYSVTSDYRHTTTPKVIKTSNGSNTRHGTVLHVTDSVGKRIAWKAHNGKTTGKRAGNYAFSKSKPSAPMGIWAASRYSSPSSSCDASKNNQQDGRMITFCILPPRNDGGSPILHYDVRLTSTAGDVISTRVNYDAKRFTIYNLPASGSGRQWTISARAVNANGASAWTSDHNRWSRAGGGIPEGTKFSDVYRSNPHIDYIGWISQNKITNVKGSYKPGNTVNRGSMVEFMWNLAGKPALTGSVSPNKFKDIASLKKSNPNRAKAILWAAEQGITTGSPACTKATGCTFRPNDSVNRGSMAEFLYNFAGKPKTSAKMTFKDCGKLNAGRKLAIAWLKSTAVTTGSPAGSKTYKPNSKVNRGSMATFLYKIHPFVM
jgi:uncharacterized repeat protein (TIGR02543 family)